eukprot:GGOE01015086.1.p1 GENE.GGOE01015086.1~~GGOE01015086.1.p1  ORF type:complete len:1554 (+),score=465.23 GGOE01015086.1:109-4770(+)
MRNQAAVFRIQVRYAVNDNPDKVSSRCYTCSRSCLHSLRYFLRQVVTSPLWLHFTLLLIGITILLLGATIPPYDGRWFSDASMYAILGINAIFTVEMVMKMITFGIIFPVKQEQLAPAKPYFRWLLNWFDFLSVVLVYVFPKSVFASMLKIARFSLPTETVVRKRQKVNIPRMVINTLVVSIPEILVLILVLLYYCLWWSTAGVVILGDKLNNRCYPPANINLTSCLANTTYCATLWPSIVDYLPPSQQLPCDATNSTLLWTYGRSCQLPGEVCTIRPEVAFASSYQNVLAALMRTFQVSLLSDVWQLNGYASAAMGSLIFPYYVFPVLAGAYGLLLLFPVLILKNYGLVSREVRSSSRHDEEEEKEDFSLPPRRLRQQTMLLVESKVFIYGMLLVTVVASLVIMIDWTGAPDSLLNLLNIITIVCWVLFIMEAVLKMLAYGVRGYFSRPLNVLDFFIIVLEAFKVILNAANVNLGGFGPWLDGLESFRLLRLLRMYIQLPLGLTLNTMAEAFMSILPKYVMLEVFHLAILWLFSICYCNVASSLKTGNLAPGFSNLLDSFSTTLPASTGQQVVEDLAYLFSAGSASGMQIFTLTLVSFCLVVVARFLFVPLYLAVQLEHFEAAMRKASSKTLAFRHFDSVDPRNVVLRQIFDEKFHFAADKEGNANEEAQLEFYPTDPLKVLVPHDRFLPRSSANPRLAAILVHSRWRLARDVLIIVHSIGATLMTKGSTDLVASIGKGICGLGLLFLAFEITASINVFGARTLVRAKWPLFDVLAFVCGCVAFYLGALNAFIFLRLLVVLQERFSAIRLVIRGLLKRADCLVMGVLLAFTLYLTFATFGVKLLKGRFHQCLVCIPTPGVGLYERRSCDPLTPYVDYCNFTACMAANVTGAQQVAWANKALNFDNIFHSLVTLLSFMTNQGWPEVMLDGMHVGPSEGGCIGAHDSSVNIIYFTALLIVCFYISMTWYTAIVAHVLAKCRTMVAPYDSLEERQQEWVKLMTYYTNEIRLQQYVFRENVLGGPGLIKPTCHQKLRLQLIRLFQKPWYGIAFVIAEFVLIILFAIQYSSSLQAYKTVLKYSALGLVFLWTLEAILKNVAYRPTAYFSCRFFRFEFATLVLDFLFIFIDFYCGDFAIYGWARLFRLGVYMGHVWSHLQRAGGQLVQFQFRPIHPILATVSFMLRGIVAVLAIYAVFVGFLAFFAVETLQDIHRDNWAVTGGLNFGTWGDAWLQVHAMATGSYWVRILELVKQQPPFCSYEADAVVPCLGLGAAIFCVVPPIMGLLTLTLTIAVVVDNAAIIELNRAKPTFLLQRFAQAWARIDVDGTRKMSLGSFMFLWRWLQQQQPKPKVLHAGVQQILDPSLGRHRTLLARLNFPVILWPVDRDQRVDFTHAIHAIICHLAGVGFVEHHLLCQLLAPFEEVLPAPFFTIYHVRFSEMLAEIWEAWQPIRTNELLRRRRRLDEEVRIFLKALDPSSDEMDVDFRSGTPHTTPNCMQLRDAYHPDELLENTTHRSARSESSPTGLGSAPSQRESAPRRGRSMRFAEPNEWVDDPDV